MPEALGENSGRERPDVVAFTSDSASVFLGDGKGGFGAGISTNVVGPGFPYGKFVGADFNGDGKPDLMVIGGDSTYALYGNGDGTFQTPVTVAVAPPWTAVAADFNGDGRLDLTFLAVNGLAESLQVLFGAAP